ncbi:hypothetical protein RHGRI_033370 [Rhododendron griersonianum]|uniref:Uncharacterized protein n=1 Tax=Rhododendron griersonianum TaxID=479676 RepID=A0AAV6HWG0_9ERIC|nr:hypothetical protein RHGRI_033370 [Rhododendron griersonianum]
MESKFSAAASSSTVTFPIKRLTPKEMEAKREKGLCYNCDEKLVRGHQCQKKQLYLMIGEDEEEDDTGQDTQDVEEPIPYDDRHISVHALFGSNSLRTMRVVGYWGLLWAGP